MINARSPAPNRATRRIWLGNPRHGVFAGRVFILNSVSPGAWIVA
jgi:hypothetical protein